MTTPTDELTPLQMAQNCARAIVRIGEWQHKDPFDAHLKGAGHRARETAQLGGALALVSIAESLDRIADELARARMARNGGHQ